MHSLQRDSPASHGGSSSNWSSLGMDLLELIIQRLPLSDYVRFGAVCRWWNIVFSSKRCPPAPLLMWLPIGNRDAWPLSFYCHSESQVYRFRPLNENYHFLGPLYERVYPQPGYYRGWLMLEVVNFRSRLLLYNPISGARIQIPPPPDRVYSCKTIVIPDLPLVDDESESQPVVARFEYFKRELWTWRACNGCQGWTLLLLDKSPNSTYFDFIFYKGSLYFVTGNGELRLVEINRPHRHQHSDHDDPRPPNHVVIGPHIFSAKDVENASLVECMGDLLFVSRLSDGSGKNRLTRVFKANLRCGRWEEVESLGHHSLFVRTKTSICMSPKDLPCLTENCVYFANGHDTLGRDTLWRYNLADKTSSVEVNPYPLQKTWLVPQLSWSN